VSFFTARPFSLEQKNKKIPPAMVYRRNGMFSEKELFLSGVCSVFLFRSFYFDADISSLRAIAVIRASGSQIHCWYGKRREFRRIIFFPIKSSLESRSTASP